MLLRMASPIAYQATAGTALAGAGQAMGAAIQQFTRASDLTSSWTGGSSQAHGDRAAKLIEAAGRVVQAIAQANTIANSGGARLQALKVQNDAIVSSATAGQYQVLPVGQVIPGPAHYAKASGPHGAALMKLFWMIARLYTGQITATTTQTSATDAQVAATMAAVAMQFISDLMAERGNSGANGPGVTTPTVTTPGSRPLDPFTMPVKDPSTVDDGIGGTTLAGVGTLTGAGGLGGAGGIGGAGGLGGVGGIGGLSGIPAGAGAAGLMMGGAGAGQGGGAVGAGAAARGAAGTPMGMMPMGAGHGAGQSGDRRGTETWLHEDRDPFEPDDDAPGAVLS